MKLFHANSGSPAHTFKEEPCEGNCATCGDPITTGVPNKSLTGTSFGRQSDFLKFGDHVCSACAWMYSFPKETHRNVIAAGDKIWWPMISHDSATEERPSWLDVLNAVAAMSGDTPIQGVLTTDPKPRLWPLSQPMTVDNFGLYVHCLDYDVSEFREFSLAQCLLIAAFVSDRLTEGYSKRACFFGLLNDYKKAKKNPDRVMAWELELKTLRPSPAFIPGLLIAGKKK